MSKPTTYEAIAMETFPKTVTVPLDANTQISVPVDARNCPYPPSRQLSKDVSVAAANRERQQKEAAPPSDSSTPLGPSK